VRWGIDVWYLLTYNGMVGEGRAFLVDKVEPLVVRERDFQFRFPALLAGNEMRTVGEEFEVGARRRLLLDIVDCPGEIGRHRAIVFGLDRCMPMRWSARWPNIARS